MFLADRARHDDGRKGQCHSLQKFQRAQPAKTRHLVVGDDDVPRLAVQCGPHRFGRLDPLVRHGVATAAEFGEYEQRIVLRVFNQQAANRLVHGAPSIGVAAG